MTDLATPPHRRLARTLTVGALVAASVLPLTGGAPATADGGAFTGSPDLAEEGWAWPVREFRIERAFEAPAHRYGPGHRGIDLRLLSSAKVRAPAAGVVAFSGQVAGRGVVTIDHGDGLVTTLEPIESEIAPGTPVDRAAPLGFIADGGHAVDGTLHFGVRLHGEYINPMLLLGGVPRAILLPCC